MGRFVGILGIITILGLGYLMSSNRKAIRLRTIGLGLGLQFVFALFVLKVNWGRELFAKAGHAVEKFLSFSVAGSSFVFGDLGLGSAGKVGMVFAFYILPTIIFVSAFFAVMYHFGIMQVIIKGFAKLMRAMGASGAESLDVAASIFMGQTEAPLTIRPFLPSLTRSELMTVMTAGMAHVSGSIMAAYIAFGVRAEFLLSAVIMTAPGTILMAKLLVPETETPLTGGREVPGAQAAAAEVGLENGNGEHPEEKKEANVLGAIAKGTTDGLHLALNVGAMLIAFIALIALLNGILGGIHNHISWFPASLESIFGVIFAPIAWVIGIPWKDCLAVGNLLGTRMAVNELVAYSMMGAQKATLDPRSFTIATFALCGFANFSSIGIQIGGISALAPNRRTDLAKLGFRAMLAGTMANLMSASIVGILLS